MSRCFRAFVVFTALAAVPPSAQAEKKYGPGVTDTEIKIGQTMPYSGPLSAFGTIGKAQAAYFEMINARGGVNGRKIKLLSLDDGYSPPKTIEQTRKLVESDEVLLLFSSFGTPPNTAAMKYLNAKKVPQLLIAATGADTFFSLTSPKFSAQAIRKAYDIGWKPLYFIPYSATSVSAVLQPAGLQKSVGVISSAYVKDPTDPQWKTDAATKEWPTWIKSYYPDGDVAEIYNVYAYTNAQLLIQVLKQCGDELTRENVMM